MNSPLDQFEERYELIKHLSISHMTSTSVNTPLTSIMGYSNVLLKELCSPENADQQELLEIIYNNAEYLQEYLQRMLQKEF